MAKQKLLRHVFKFHGLVESFKFAFAGLFYLFLYHRNMRIIFMIGFTAILLGIYFQLTGFELMALSMTIVLVFMAEMFNTAIEMLMNMFTMKYRVRIKLVKDIAAAVVLLASLNALIVGWVLFAKRLF